MKGARLGAAIVLFKPEFWPAIGVHVLAGYVYAVGTGPLDHPLMWLQGAAAASTWTLLLFAPAAALSGLFGALPGERSEGRRDEAFPLGWVCLGLILAGLLLSAWVAWAFQEAFLAGILLAVLHAAPPLRLGRVRATAVTLQALGLGALTFYAGAAAAGDAIDPKPEMAMLVCAFMLLVVASHVLRSRGRSLIPACVIALAVIGAGVCLGLAEHSAGQWRKTLLFLPPLAAWAILGLARFVGSRRDGSPPLAPIMGAWLLSDAAVILSAFVR